MKKKLVLTLLTALLSINILLTGCENDSEADIPEPSSAILQTDSIKFSDTSDSIISDLNLLESLRAGTISRRIPLFADIISTHLTALTMMTT